MYAKIDILCTIGQLQTEPMAEFGGSDKVS